MAEITLAEFERRLSCPGWVRPGSYPLSGRVRGSGRRYVMRPDLTARTHEQYSHHRADVLGVPFKAEVPQVEIPPRQRKRRSRPRTRGEAALHCRRYSPSDWFSVQGVTRKRRLIESKGLPAMHRWRFTTLTVCRERFACSELQSYLAGKKRMRGFMERLRVLGIIERHAKWAWKLEFHADGFPHWHLLIDRKRKLSGKDMKAMSEAWGLGRVHNEMVREKAGQMFTYNFKYAFKPALVEHDDDGPLLYDEPAPLGCPDWFADYIGSRRVKVKWTDADGIERQSIEDKPATFARVRFWQTSPGFYTKPQRQHHKSEAKPQKSSSVVQTVRALVNLRQRCLQVIARDNGGTYQISSVVIANDDGDKFWNRIAADSILGGSIGLAVGSWIVPVSLLNRITSCTLVISKLCLQNTMTLQSAQRLRDQRQTLLTC